MIALLKKIISVALQPKYYRIAIVSVWDYCMFAVRYRFLRKKPALKSNGKRVLLLLMDEFIPRVKLEALFLKGIQIHGGQPIILTNRPYLLTKAYCRLFGLQEFVYFDELLEEAGAMVPADLPETILREHASFDAFMAYTYRGAEVGKHTLSTAIRKEHYRSVAYDDPEVQEQLKGFLLQSLRAVHAAELLFDRHKIDTVIAREKGYSPDAEIFDIALQRGLDGTLHPHAHHDGALSLKRYTKETQSMHPFSLSPKTWEYVQKMPWTKEQDDSVMQMFLDSYEKGTWMNRKFLLKGKQIKSADAVRAQLGLDPQKKTAVIFSHVLWDATFFFGTSLFKDYEEWLKETIKAACSNTAVNWVIKLHPDYTWKLTDPTKATQELRAIIAHATGVETLPSHVTIVEPQTDISTYSFFSMTDYCITVRGTVGIEASCFGIPVLTAGTGRYSDLGFTIDSKTREEYLERLAHIQDIAPLSEAERTLARKHAYVLFRQRLLHTETFSLRTAKQMTKGSVGLWCNLDLFVHSYNDLVAADDLRRFAKWVLESADTDYLEQTSDAVN